MELSGFVAHKGCPVVLLNHLSLVLWGLRAKGYNPLVAIQIAPFGRAVDNFPE